MTDDSATDDTLLDQLVEIALASLDQLLANIPQPPWLLHSSIDSLRRSRKYHGELGSPEKRRALANQIRSLFHSRRKDGIRTIILPRRIESRLEEILALCETD